MLRTFCKSKITKIFVTHKDMRYSGSLGIDKALMKEADIFVGEQVHVLNMSNGERLITYAIEEDENSGKVVLYGPAVRKGETGDELVVLTYCLLEAEDGRDLRTRHIRLGKNNRLGGEK